MPNCFPQNMSEFLKLPCGIRILSLYNLEQKLTPEIRELLCIFIVQTFVQNNTCMTKAVFENVRDQIVQRFVDYGHGVSQIFIFETSNTTQIIYYIK